MVNKSGQPVLPARSKSYVADRPAKLKAKRKVGPKEVLQLLHRTAIFGCALVYIITAFSACYDAVGLLRGRNNPFTAIEDNPFDLVGSAVGTSFIRESLLVKGVFGDRPVPINGTLYLSSSGYSQAICENAGELQTQIYNDEFLRSIYTEVTNGTGYHHKLMSPDAIELIAPVVDCSASDVSDGDGTSGKYFYLVRDRSTADNVSMLTITMSNQQYYLPSQDENGPASIVVVQFINTMQDKNVTSSFAVSLGYPYEKFSFRAYDYVNTTIDGMWTLRSVPRSRMEIPKVLQTSCKTGFYIKAESEQSNVNNYLWIRETDATLGVTNLRWTSVPVLHDSWAWVHAAQFFIGISILSNLFILCLATFHNIRAGKWWIGDAFVTISSNQALAGIAVLVSWFMNEFWALHEFCFQEANEVSGYHSKIIYDAPMRAGLLTLYLSACGLVGHTFRERIDPLFAMICYHVGYAYRVEITKLFPSIRDAVVDYSSYSYMKGVQPPLTNQDKISPMRFWTANPVGKRNYTFVIQCLFPIYITLIFVVVYIIARKVNRRIFPKKARVLGNTTGTVMSEDEKSLVGQKRVLTLFELATGAELENRYGVVSNYETCVIIKGVKYASPDGIYSNGFVIANQKYVVQTSDYWSIVLMKILGRRFRNIYVYDVDGKYVKETARLVYPHTLTALDLFNINVGVLS